MCYTVNCTGTACFNQARSILMTECSHSASIEVNAISTTFNHQILHNMSIDFILCWQNSRRLLHFFICSSPCKPAVSQFNLPTDFAVKVVTTRTLLQGGCVEYDKNNNITSTKVNTTAHWSYRAIAARWSHRGALEHNREPGKKQ